MTIAGDSVVGVVVVSVVVVVVVAAAAVASLTRAVRLGCLRPTEAADDWDAGSEWCSATARGIINPLLRAAGHVSDAGSAAATGGRLRGSEAEADGCAVALDGGWSGASAGEEWWEWGWA